MIVDFRGERSNASHPRLTHAGQQHSVVLGSITYKDTKFQTATIRLFSDSGAGDKGMPFYTVIYGSEGKHDVISRPRAPHLPRRILL